MTMGAPEARETARAELQAGMDLTKCRQWGRMREMLEALRPPAPDSDAALEELARDATMWLEQMAPTRHACLGCEHCFPAVALNALTEAELIDQAGLGCAFYATGRSWPVVAGEYVVTCTRADCPVAVSTLASAALAGELAQRAPAGLCIVGKTETENIGIDKVVKNLVANPSIRYLIVAGHDPAGHRSGQTLMALASNGVDEHMGVVGSLGKRPILRNVTNAEVQAFRNQVQLFHLIGCEDADRVVASIEELTARALPTTAACECGGACATSLQPAPSAPEGIEVRPSERIEMDRAGYFVIIPDALRRMIVVEHYAYDNQLQHVIEGRTSRDLYRAIIDGGWVSQLSHAAYLGKELAAAELSLRHGFRYLQDST